MRAAMYFGNQNVEVIDVPDPTPAAGQAKIKVSFNGICGSDLHEYYTGPVYIPSEAHH